MVQNEPVIRLIATDIDGTLLNIEREISLQNYEALQRASAAGLIICLASGRLYTSLKPIAELGNVVGPLVMCNGAYVETAEGDVVLDTCIPQRAQEAILDYAKKFDVHANVYQPRSVTVSQNKEAYALYRSRLKMECIISTPDDMRSLRATKMIFVDHADAVKKHWSHFADLAEGLGVELTTSEPEYLEFLPKGVNKGTALAHLCEKLGVAQSEVAAIGDFYNDLEMVTWAGFGGAVGNAVPELKAVADVVVKSNIESGFAEFVNLVLEKNSAALDANLAI